MLRLFKQNYPIRNIFFVSVEGLVIFISVLLATRILYGADLFDQDSYLTFKAVLITFVFLICLYYNDLYDFKVTDTFTELGIRLFQALGVAAIFLAGVYYLFPEIIIGRGIFVLSVAIVIVMIVSWRLFYSVVLKYGLFDQKIILLGSGKLAQNIYNEIIQKRDCGYTISAVVTDKDGQFHILADHKPEIACSIVDCNLCILSQELGIDKIVVAIKERRGAFPTKELLDCRVAGIDIIEGNSFHEMLTGKLSVKDINPAWLIFSDGFKKPTLRKFIKRTEDILFSFLLLILCLPITIFTAFLIKIDSRGPVFFSQERVGRRKKTYMVHKFRSMVTDAESASGPVWAQKNDSRVTRVGKFIRKWRIDEIPQLWNVLKGEMSFIGPRPEREFFVHKLEAIIPYYKERFTVKPGLTGWAQVCYGYGDSIEDAMEKLNYELFYIKNYSIFMDFVIVVRTVKTVLFGVGAR
ncbi:MAG: TIGR03013 family PEP-CTERM/XrtA system glycosyltransferase [Proteobacteria bacterium]|nr:TIGR03013 family PEP-CTERM/XrtA system glycosyltransferase [Pseudomonadota bacterium]